MEAKKNVFLEERPVAALMRQYALPCVISLLVGALYNIVDQIYIANADYLGAWGNAANTVVFPLTVVALALAVMVGDGCCAYVSLHLGKGQQQTAARSVGGSILLTLGMSAALTRFICSLATACWHCSAVKSVKRPSPFPGNISFTLLWASPSICSGRP